MQYRHRHVWGAITMLLVSSVVLACGATLATARLFVRAQQEVRIAEASDEAPVRQLLSGRLPESALRSAVVSLFVVGDVMLDRKVASQARRSGDLHYPFAFIANDARFQNADLRLMNLEGPLSAARRLPEKEIDFAFDPAFAQILQDTGFDLVSQANNHALDQGKTGAAESRAHLARVGILSFGDEVADDRIAIATTTVRGRRLTFVGFNSVSNSLDFDVASSTLAFARGSSDLMIAYMHWGAEYRDRPTRDQEHQAKWLIDHGVDIVIGAHPHWTQGLSLYKGKPIFYSLGNFVFDQDWSQETGEGLTTRLTISDQQIAIDLYPVRIDKVQPRFVEGTEREDRLRSLAAISDPSLTHQILQGSVVVPFVR